MVSAFRQHRALLTQLCRFAIVGIGNTVLSYAVYSALVEAHVGYAVAGAVGFIGGAVNGYILNRRWTFACQDSRRARIRYLVVQGCGLAMTDTLLWLIVGVGDVKRLFAYALAVPVVTMTTFAANRRWTFADQLA